IADTLRGYGVEIITGWQTEAVETHGDATTVVGKTARETARYSAEQLLVAAGTDPNVADLTLEAVAVRLGRRGIVTDEHLRTSAPHIFAAGDVTEQLHYTHTAHAMGTLAGHNAASDQPRTLDLAAVPRIVFTHLELAAVGEREETLRKEDAAFVVGTAQIGTLGRA